MQSSFLVLDNSWCFTRLLSLISGTLSLECFETVLLFRHFWSKTVLQNANCGTVRKTHKRLWLHLFSHYVGQAVHKFQSTFLRRYYSTPSLCFSTIFWRYFSYIEGREPFSLSSLRIDVLLLLCRGAVATSSISSTWSPFVVMAFLASTIWSTFLWLFCFAAYLTHTSHALPEIGINTYVVYA